MREAPISGKDYVAGTKFEGVIASHLICCSMHRMGSLLKLIVIGGVLTAVSLPTGASGGGNGDDDQYVLAVSWQPAFCEQRPNKPECQSQTPDRFYASHFTLHGLWPQPRGKVYCNVDPAQVRLDKDRQWPALPALVLAPATRGELDTVMPGSRSGLARHEWVKHGSCYDGASAERYFADSLRLLRQLNASVVRDLFAGHVGRQLAQAQILDAFDAAFGAGASTALEITCKSDGARRLISELKLALKGPIGPAVDLGPLLRAAPPAGGGCAGGGIVDPVGLQ